MNISYNWLKQYVAFDLTAEKLADILTSIGLEVEDMEVVEEIPGGLKGVMVAEVLECEDHPDSDHLHVTKLNIGQEETIQVVCGAANVAKGQKVLVATIGTVLSDDKGGEFKIKKSKMRGIESHGMICAEDELGLGNSHDGIMVLDHNAVPGTAAKDYLNLATDTILSIGLTPNRIDAASHIGVARDLAAYLKFNNMGGDLTLPDVSEFKQAQGQAIPVEVHSPEAAPRYVGLTFTNVKVGPSPEWLQKLLLSIGLKPINNIVDITNYLMFEMGQPLHAFDADKIAGSKVVVRKCEEGTKFKTLDGIERTLSSEDLMICDAEKPMCIAGVFGGEDSGISDSTTNVFLESAYFNPVSVRKTSKRHGIKTDASFRYERGVDPTLAMNIAKRAALMFQEYASAQIVGELQEFYPEAVELNKVSLNLTRIQKFIGKDIPHSDILSILKHLEFEIISNEGEIVEVSVPAYRVDVYRECDVVEDILRIYGYNNIELPTTLKASINASPKPDPEQILATASELLVANGFVECMSNSLTKGDYYAGLETYKEENMVRIMNPLSNDLNVMRQTLLFSGLETVEYNIKRQTSNLKIFEFGNVYFYSPEKDATTQKAYSEQAHLQIMMTGKGETAWRNTSGVGHYFTLKGYVELLLKRFGINLYNFETQEAPADLYSEGLIYKLNGKDFVTIGVVAPKILKKCDIKATVFACDINWDLLLSLYRKHKVLYKELPKFPAVRRDLALLLDQGVTFSQLRKAALSTEKRLLKSVGLFDVYKGDKIPSDKKQYALSFVFQDMEKTLTDKQIDQVVSKILSSFQHQFGAVLR